MASAALTSWRADSWVSSKEEEQMTASSCINVSASCWRSSQA
jgi:hypothetical protein